MMAMCPVLEDTPFSNAGGSREAAAIGPLAGALEPGTWAGVGTFEYLQ